MLAFDVKKDLNEQQILTGLYHNIHEFSFFYLPKPEWTLFIFILLVCFYSKVVTEYMKIFNL